jgi:pimeloyl-ACP methyl ester carboxylesterase
MSPRTRHILSILGPVMTLFILLLAWWLWTPDLERGVLEARYLRAPGDMVELRGLAPEAPGVGATSGPPRVAPPAAGSAATSVLLHVRDSGPRDAPAVLLLHGFGASLHTWEPWTEALAREHRVIRFDLPGSGLSPPDPSGLYTDARSQQLALALLDQLGVARASMVGHSIGGRLAWHLAAEHPGRIDKLVLLAPDGYASPGFDYGRAPEVPASFQLMRQVLPRPLLRASLAPAFADPAQLSEELTARYFDLMRAPGGRDALLARMAQTVLVPPAPLLARIHAPTLLVWGERDRMIPFANSADYLQAIGGARLVSVPDVGHLTQEETSRAAPGLALKAVQEFLR